MDKEISKQKKEIVVSFLNIYKMDIEKGHNPAKKRFISRFNELLKKVVQTCFQEGFATKENIKIYMMKEHYMNNHTINRYIKYLKINDMLKYDEDRKMFLFSDTVKRHLQTETMPEIEEEDEIFSLD